jgi:hypothetical protein
MPANAVAVTANFEAITSASEIFAPNLKIYPNPFTDAVRIEDVEITMGHAPLSLRITNAAGVIVHTQKITSPNETIRLEHLPQGVYFFTFENGKQSKTMKVVKEN